MTDDDQGEEDKGTGKERIMRITTRMGMAGMETSRTGKIRPRTEMTRTTRTII